MWCDGGGMNNTAVTSCHTTTFRRHLAGIAIALERMTPGVGDNLVVTLTGGHEVEMSRRQSARLREILSL